MQTQSHPYYCTLVLGQAHYPDTAAMSALERNPEPQPCVQNGVTECWRIRFMCSTTNSGSIIQGPHKFFYVSGDVWGPVGISVQSNNTEHMNECNV